MLTPPALLLALSLALPAAAQNPVSFPTSDGAHICADLYPAGPRAVVLAHGGRFNKESWRPQALILQSHGFQVLAFDFRGVGCSSGPGEKDFDHAPFDNDVLAAVRYLKSHGASSVSLIGGSFGGSAAGDAAIRSAPGEIARIVFLAAAPNLPASQLHTPSLFLIARRDSSGDGPRLPHIQAQFRLAPNPKRLVILPGSAHAQFLFQTNQSPRVMNEILRFLQQK